MVWAAQLTHTLWFETPRIQLMNHISKILARRHAAWDIQTIECRVRDIQTIECRVPQTLKPARLARHVLVRVKVQYGIKECSGREIQIYCLIRGARSGRRVNTRAACGPWPGVERTTVH
jgi:hypothetical protein